MRNVFTALMGLTLGLLFLVSCGDDNFVDPAPGEITVSGTVIAYTCGWLDTPFPYSETGRQAIVRLIGTNGDVFVAATDDSSHYSMVVDTGEYLVEIISWHAWPLIITETHLTENTVFDPTFSFQFLYPDTVTVDFYYDVAGDSLGEGAERAQIETLNGFIGGIDYAGARRTVMSAGPGTAYVTYTAGTAPNKYVSQVCDESNRVIRDFSSMFHESMYVNPTTFVCIMTDDQVSRPVLLSPEEAVERLLSGQ